jgi:uncharacterized protein YllA (UPF0747 family)
MQEVSRCHPEYIVGLYSTFADRFDELLVEKLQYKGYFAFRPSSCAIHKRMTTKHNISSTMHSCARFSQTEHCILEMANQYGFPKRNPRSSEGIMLPLQ